MKTILLGAKHFAIQAKSVVITIEHFVLALECVDISDQKLITLLKAKIGTLCLGIQSHLTETKLEEAKNAPKISYDKELKNFLKELEDNGFESSAIVTTLHVNREQASLDCFSHIKHIKEALMAEALGQGRAVEAICDGLMKAVYSSNANRPYASFLFAGPLSPAKLHIAKTLSTLLPEYQMIHLPMSSYSTGNGSMQLFGIPAPYSGEKEGILTTFVKENPKAIIIVDELELCEKEAQIFFSKIINEGKCTDSFSSEEIDFTQCIVILTTSAGKEVYSKKAFMDMAQNDQRLAERMILDALYRETGEHKTKESSQNKESLLFESSLIVALRKCSIAFFGKLGFNVSMELVKKSLNLGIADFENKIGIHIEIENIDVIAKFLILSSGPEFDLESVQSKGASILLDILTDQAIALEVVPEKVKIGIDEKANKVLKELVASATDDKLIHTLFRKSQTLTYQHTYEKELLTFHSFILEKVKRAKDFGGEGGFSVELPDVTFEKIAGHHKVKERLKEAIAILKNKTLSETLGEHMPKGMLLYGPPGTGKTMLAKAFAKEADLPFIATTGPDMLDEKMMKTVFDKARDYAPAIVFIDEIDVFKHRGHGYGTDFLINKLLTLIDGFSTNEEERIFIVAATNLKDNIDEAIIRSGRIDLHILVDTLDKDARTWFIDKMLKNKHFNSAINKERILRYTTNFSGADLQKIENESILYANRKGLSSIDESILVEQINTLKYGAKIENNALEVMLQRTAYHEAGHAIISKVLMPFQKIEQVTVTPRSDALGFVSYDTQDYQNHTKAWFEQRICVALAGRLAEMHEYGAEGIEGGASSDLKQANSLAYTAVAKLGMDTRLFNICVESYEKQLLFQVQIEEIILEWLHQLTQKTQELIDTHWKKIDQLAKKLMDVEVVEGEEIEKLVQ